VDIIKLLVDEGISVKVTNTNVNSPLHISALHGKLEATKTLVKRGAVLTTLINMVTIH
jgi:ankyrin repeat protein